jgi:glycosyltransferase involved in cell wall biosynthesis
MFSDIYTPSRDGVRTSIEVSHRALRELGHEVTVVAPHVPGFVDKEPGIIRLASVGNPINQSTAPGFRMAAPYPGLVGKLSREIQADIIHSHTQGTLGMLGFQVARARRLPLIHTVHGFMYEVARQEPVSMTALLGVMVAVDAPFLLRYGRPLPHFGLPKMPARERWMLNYLLAIMTLAGDLIVPSPHVEARLRRYGIRLPIHVVPSTVEPGIFEHPPALPAALKLPPAHGVRLVSVGRVSAEKRTEELIESLGRLPRDPAWDCVIVGDGPSYQACRDRAKALGLMERVHFVGSQPTPVVAGVLHTSDIYVLNSYHFDTQALTIVEAVDAGLPVVYCDPLLTIGLSGGNAVRAADKSPAAMAGVLGRLIADDSERRRLAAASTRLAAEFKPTAIAALLLAAYDSAIAHQATGSG